MLVLDFCLNKKKGRRKFILWEREFAYNYKCCLTKMFLGEGCYRPKNYKNLNIKYSKLKKKILSINYSRIENVLFFLTLKM